MKWRVCGMKPRNYFGGSGEIRGGSVMLGRIYYAVSVIALGLVLTVALLVIHDRTRPEVYAVGEPRTPLAVTVVPGDTLWGIAKRYYPGEHTGERVFEIRQLNPGLDPGRLMPGQTVWLPQD